MPLIDLEPGQSLGLQRGTVAVCIPVFGALGLFAQCLKSVLAHTDPAVIVVICDDAAVDPAVQQFVRDTVDSGAWSHSIAYLRHAVNRGFVVNANSAFAACAPADVVLLNSDCVVAEGWLEGLREAAHSDSKVATVTALTNAGTIVSVPERNQPLPVLPQNLTLDGVAAEIETVSQRLFADLPTCVGHCVYFRRSALELVGDLDETFSPGYEEEVEFSQRCVVHGLRHILADQVFVLHRHSGSFGHSERVQSLRARHHLIVVDRFPYYDRWVAEAHVDPYSRLARAVATARSAMQGPSVTIDGRSLTRFMTGTALATLELIGALDIHTDLQIRVLVPNDLGGYAAGVLAGRSAVQLLDLDAAGTSQPSDVCHRPYQVTSPDDARLLRHLGHRLVITQLDNIAYRNPAYFEGYEQWRQYRRMTMAALAGADQVVFISRDAARDARTLDLVDEERINVIPLGTEQTLSALYPEPVRPAIAGRIGDRPFLLCLGTDFLHKNRPFALRLLDALTRSGEFDGLLVMAGPKVAAGSSAGEEAAYLATRPKLAARVLDVGAVEEAEKQWLLASAAAVVYPTTYEGFGLIPFEAARVGTPCVFPWHTSLADNFSRELALIVPWDEDETAKNVAPILVAGDARTRLVDGINMAGARLTAARNAQLHADVYRRALAGRAPLAAALSKEMAELEQARVQLEAQLRAARGELDEIYDDPLNRGLAGRYAVLPRELRRPVLAMASRPALRAAVTMAYRAAYTVRHGGRSRT